MFSLTWALTLCALYGTYLNAKKKREGFYWWVVTDAAFCAVNWTIDQYALSALFFIYTLLAIKGLREWKKN